MYFGESVVYLFLKDLFPEDGLTWKHCSPGSLDANIILLIFRFWDPKMSSERWEFVVHNPFWNLVEQSLIHAIILFVQTGCHSRFKQKYVSEMSYSYGYTRFGRCILSLCAKDKFTPAILQKKNKKKKNNSHKNDQWNGGINFVFLAPPP